MRAQEFTISVLSFTILSFFCFCFTTSFSQNVAKPVFVSTGVFLGVTAPLKDMPTIKNMKKNEKKRAHIQEAIEEYENSFERNPDMKRKNYSDYINSLPGRPDPAWQKEETGSKSLNATPNIVKNFAGQNSNAYPPDCNGAVGPNHFMQTINVTYTIYNKTGNLLAGPSNMNSIFSGVSGSNCNDGDPIIIYDEQADRWLAAEFSLCGGNDLMLVAVSTTNNPTGTWYKYSFDVDDFPDYPKFGIWNDGYYLSTNNGGAKDVYVFERSVMLTGGSNPQMIGFSNPNRPNSGFHCIMPCDNDFASAPADAPGMFITINDDVWGGTDALWIYELDADWVTPANSTFARVQVLTVPLFDSNFGSSWDNIAQYNTSQKLDAINQILMYRAQYINFGGYQSIVCQHTVDVDGTDHAGIRWYELRNTGTTWEVRQSGTYAPDAAHRWLGAISMNMNHEIGLAYSFSNPSGNVYPSLKFTGQTSTENSLASGAFDVTETNIATGTGAQTGANRWGDYAQMSVDPIDQNTFWFTSEYGKTSNKGTQIIGFYFSLPTSPPVGNFSANTTSMLPGATVQFTDLSTNIPNGWLWDFPGGTPSSSTDQNPIVVYATAGVYDVALIVVNGYGTDTVTKTAYINVIEQTPIIAFVGNPSTITVGATIFYTDQTTFSPDSWLWDFPGGTPSTSTLQNPSIVYDTVGVYDVSLIATNLYGPDTLTKTAYITVNPPPATGGWIEQASGFADPSRGISGVSIVDDITAWAWAYDGASPTNYISEFTRTTNGGNLWTANSITGFPTLSIANICAISDSVAYVAMFPTGASGGAILKTTDGGATWVQQTTALWNNSASFANFVHFFDANNGICMGDPIGSPKKFEVYTTTDGGTTWVLNTHSGLAMTTGYGYVNDFCAVGNAIWFGTNTNKVFRSFDKGMTWASSSTALTETNLVSFADVSNGFACYTAGATFAAKKTTNGGSSWTAYTVPATMNKSDLSLVPGLANTYVSVGASAPNGSAYTRNLGTSWDTIDGLTQYTSVDFLNQNTGYAGGFNVSATEGGIYKWFGTPVLSCNATPPAIAYGDSSSLVTDVSGGWGNYVYTWSSVPFGFTNSTASPVVYPAIPTDYTVVVTSAFNEVSSTCSILVDPVGMKEIENSSIHIYPNPTADQLNIFVIGMVSKGNVNVKIYNVVGEVMYNQSHNTDNTIVIDLEKYSSGVYFVGVYSNVELIKKKITVIK